jgi:hypothetical protein
MCLQACKPVRAGNPALAAAGTQTPDQLERFTGSPRDVVKISRTGRRTG